MNYYICPECGAVLDAGERCEDCHPRGECHKTKRAPEAAATAYDAKAEISKDSASIITERKENVK